MCEPYLRKGIDIFKASFSVSGTAKIEMLKRMNDDTFFCLFPKRHTDLFEMFCENITCGLSIVFTRLAIKGETKIRPHEVSNPEICASIVGLDTNSLYLHVINQDMPTDFLPSIRSFRELPSRSLLQIWSGVLYNKFGERRLTQYSLLVDGFAPASQHVFEYFGCFWHACSRCDAVRNSDGSLMEMHPVRKKKNEEIRKETAKKVEIPPPQTSHYVDLSNSFLSVKTGITTATGENLAENAECAPAGNFLNTIWSQVDLFLNGVLVTPANNNYAYRSYIETLLSYGKEATNSQLSSILWYRNTSDHFDAKTDANAGYTKRKAIAAQSRQFEFAGRLHLDLYFQDRYLINGVEIKPRLIRSKDVFSLHGAQNQATNNIN